MSSMNDPETPDNMLCIITDQQRQDSIGAYGNEFVDTPNLDRLADSGTRFDRAYTPTAICSPARASIVTGVSPSTHGITRNLRGDTTINEDFPCYPQVLRDAGYNVGLDGKWHAGKQPADFGFDGEHYAGFMHPLHHEDYEAYLDEHGFERYTEDVVEPYPSEESEYVIGGIDTRPTEASFTSFIAEQAIERIESYAADAPETPFYIGTHFFGPHRPYFIPEEYFEMYDPDDVHLTESAVKEDFRNKPAVQKHRYNQTDLQALSVAQWRKIVAIYQGYVTFIDDQVGRILDTLERHGVADNTAVLFTTDHGSFVTSHKNLDKGPLMYEDIYNVPMIARGLGVDDVSDEFVSLLDLAPTFLDAAGIETPAVYEGRSLFDLGDDTDDWRNYVTAEFHGLNYPYEQRMLRTERYKLILNAGDVNELYDLVEDPHELTNHASNSEYSDVSAELRRILVDILNTRDDPELPEEQWLYPALSPMYFPRTNDGV